MDKTIGIATSSVGSRRRIRCAVHEWPEPNGLRSKMITRIANRAGKSPTGCRPASQAARRELLLIKEKCELHRQLRSSGVKEVLAKVSQYVKRKSSWSDSTSENPGSGKAWLQVAGTDSRLGCRSQPVWEDYLMAITGL